MEPFDPTQTHLPEDGIFGIPTRPEESSVVLIPIPWEVTTSYGSGTSDGPAAILQASPQLDLWDPDFGEAFRQGIHLLPPHPEIKARNAELKPLAQKIIYLRETDTPLDAVAQEHLEKVNDGSQWLNQQVETTSDHWLGKNKIVGAIGGDHSSPLGLLRALAQNEKGDFGVLQIDAHADLREQYQGFVHSHASIMDNLLAVNNGPQQLTQVGLRDICKEEWQRIQDDSRISAFLDRDLKRQLLKGRTWKELAQEIVETLPEKVYISFDVDGLSPDLCPHTGTPVPGGLAFDQALYLLESLVENGRQIIGFDLCEVAPGPNDEWDANVGARLAYQLSGWALKSQPDRA